MPLFLFVALDADALRRWCYNAAIDRQTCPFQMAADGEPNWNANFASETPAPLPVLNAFIEALAHVKGQYDVSDEDHPNLRR